MQRIIVYFGQRLLTPISNFGDYLLFVGKACYRIVVPPVSLKLLILQLEFVGTRSFTITVLSGIMIGAVFGLQFGNIFRIFGAESMIGAAAGVALSKELAPVIGSFLVTGRAGSSMAAEIATMRVNEQIDAMRIMAVNPVWYLVAPRIAASMIMMPLLTGIFVLAGVASSYVIGVMLFNVDVGIFFENITWIVKPEHLVEGLQKAVIFGMIFSSLGCYMGFNASGGAKGVGKAVTAAVVISLVTILISDFFLSYMQFKFTARPG
jgi:phospholipid/cholesterol/gamma-HCH transport system permease protein